MACEKKNNNIWRTRLQSSPPLYSKKLHTSRTEVTFCWPWKARKYMGNFSNSSATTSNSWGSLSSINPENCCSIILASRTLRISKLPQRVLTSWPHRSREYSLRKVVFPAPVGPVNTVNSPRRWPLSNSVRIGKRRQRTPATVWLWMISAYTSFLVTKSNRYYIASPNCIRKREGVRTLNWKRSSLLCASRAWPSSEHALHFSLSVDIVTQKEFLPRI